MDGDGATSATFPPFHPPRPGVSRPRCVPLHHSPGWYAGPGSQSQDSIAHLNP